MIFQSLANKHRRAIVYRLTLQPSSISKLAQENNLSLPAINKHIKVLEKANFLQRKKISTTHYLSLNRESLKTLHEWIRQYNPYWGSNNESLENYNESLKSDN
ncbi:MAG: winged helix-turn-helix transcriptional regulator [Thermales bacterium]|nr:winged helix-turn-helix transcriptional regulator [Thermales bacterium]